MSRENLSKEYSTFEAAGGGFRHVPRGLFAMWGTESVQFLNGLVTGDVSKIGDGQSIPIAFPNAQGRLLALARILRDGDRFLIDTELINREKLFANLQRFTFAGDFHLADLTDSFSHLEIFSNSGIQSQGIVFETSLGCGVFLEGDVAAWADASGFLSLSDELAEVLRIERGIPKYGVDGDETTVVPELGISDLISYNKGCYIGQEIIARIYFRGHVAKLMRGMVFESEEIAPGDLVGVELVSVDGKPAGRVTSATISPRRGRVIALATIRYDFREAGTELVTSTGESCRVADLPIA